MFEFFEFMSGNSDDITCFDFRIINLPGGNQVIDETISTPVESLTPEMQVEYMEVYEHLAVADRMRRREHQEEETKRKRSENFLHKIVSFCGII